MISAGHRLQRVGDRQQHRDRGDGADAGQHADQRAEHAADEAEGQILQRQRYAKTQRKVVDEIVHLGHKPIGALTR